MPSGARSAWRGRPQNRRRGLRLSSAIAVALAMEVAVVPSLKAEPLISEPAVALPPRWVVVQVDRVLVSPTRPGTGAAWDVRAPESNEGGLLCEALGLGVTVYVGNPAAGSFTAKVCSALDSPSEHPEHDPTAPDLFVSLSSGVVSYRSYVASDRWQHVFDYRFVVPLDAVPSAGLVFAVGDRDGNRDQTETIGSVRVLRAELVDALEKSPPVLSLSDPMGGLRRIELAVLPFEGQGATRYRRQTITVAANQRLVELPAFRTSAGEVVRIEAVGSYSVTYDTQRILGPDGISGRTSNNLKKEPFRSAAHGAAIAVLGQSTGVFGVVTGACSRLTTPFGGGISFGLNDDDVGNNRGSIQFTVVTRGPNVKEWENPGQPGPCSPPAR